MKPTLTAGLTHQMTYVVPENKTVPHVFEDSPQFQVMPKVFATAFLVGLLERACIEGLMAHLDWPEEQTVGTHIDIAHLAATPPGMTVTVDVELVEVDKRRLVFEVSASDGIDVISRGRHERFVVNAEKFNAGIAAKAAKAAKSG
jgi:fluoroacetyl-CoA thioesterase